MEDALIVTRLPMKLEAKASYYSSLMKAVGIAM